MSECVAARYGPQQEPVPPMRREDVFYYYVAFNGTSSYIDCGSDASLDDIHAAAFTVDAWIRIHSFTSDWPDIIGKMPPDTSAGWGLWVNNIGGLGQLEAICNKPIGDVRSRSHELLSLGTWYHITFYYDTFKIWFAIDGAWVTYDLQQGNLFGVVSDAGVSLRMGCVDLATAWLDGDISWIRISTGDRFGMGVDFAPPAMCAPPAVDGTTVELWAMDEGAGAVTAASVNSPANDGAMTDCLWHVCT